MQRTVRFLVGAGLAFALSVHALAATPKDGLLRGDVVVIETHTEVGNLVSGARYVMRLDTSRKVSVLSALSDARLVEGAYATDGAGGVSLFGSRLTWSLGAPEECLALLTGRGSCDVRVLGPLIPDQEMNGADWATDMATQFVAQMRFHLERPDDIVVRGGPCRRNAAVHQTHIADRFLAELLRFNGTILPFVSEPVLRSRVESAIDKGIDYLLLHVPPSSKTTYTDCYGGLDLITPLLVIRALDDHYRLRPRADIRAYLSRFWANLMAEGVIDAYVAQDARGSLRCANCFAAYLHIALIMETHGIAALRPDTISKVNLLLESQVKRNGLTCIDKTGRYDLSYGSWVHTSDECSQNAGYHNFIVGALIAAVDHFEGRGQCLESVCVRIRLGLEAALVWISSLSERSDDRKLYDRAPRSSSLASVAGSGSVAGADTAFRIIEKIRVVDPQIRKHMVRVLVDALDTKRGRFTALPAYLRSVALH